jgi:hypothetical protein
VERQAGKNGPAPIGAAAAANAQNGEGERSIESEDEDPFEVFLEARRLRKEALRQTLTKLRKQQCGVGPSDGGKGQTDGRQGAADMVQRQVHSFVGNVLEPRLSRGEITLREYTDVLGRVVIKVLDAHSGASDASFLEAESKKIEELVTKYVHFVKRSGAK